VEVYARHREINACLLLEDVLYGSHDNNGLKTSVLLGDFSCSKCVPNSCDVGMKDMFRVKVPPSAGFEQRASIE
jgi:hypothetical protein